MRVFRKVREDGGGRDEGGLETTAYKSPDAGWRCEKNGENKYTNTQIHKYTKLNLVEGRRVWGDAENTSTSSKWRGDRSSDGDHGHDDDVDDDVDVDDHVDHTWNTKGRS